LVEAEVPENMPLLLPLCFKVAVRILVDFCWLEGFFQILFAIYLNHVQSIFVFLLYYKLHNYFLKAKAELEADLEMEALPEALTFCWKRQKRKRPGWKPKR
jgi:hypothetical protein